MINVNVKQNVNTISQQCRMCSEHVSIDVSDKQLAMLESRSKPIQNIIPEVSPSDREIFISNICGKCFDGMFGPGPE